MLAVQARLRASASLATPFDDFAQRFVDGLGATEVRPEIGIDLNEIAGLGYMFIEEVDGAFERIEQAPSAFAGACS